MTTKLYIPTDAIETTLKLVDGEWIELEVPNSLEPLTLSMEEVKWAKLEVEHEGQRFYLTIDWESLGAVPACGRS